MESANYRFIIKNIPDNISFETLKEQLIDKFGKETFKSFNYLKFNHKFSLKANKVLLVTCVNDSLREDIFNFILEVEITDKKGAKQTLLFVDALQQIDKLEKQDDLDNTLAGSALFKEFVSSKEKGTLGNLTKQFANSGFLTSCPT